LNSNSIHENDSQAAKHDSPIISKFRGFQVMTVEMPLTQFESTMHSIPMKMMQVLMNGNGFGFGRQRRA
jgi:hypothetical protein